ncbi:D-galactonate transporter [Cupriavidus metallidurans]|jgi:D-galactonate transporter|uniref:Putative tartrate transporter n=2 Tax=Cupriavidus metallidurans TaxID=119219 RepID=Q1LM21_CUPMC|nr:MULTISPECIES: MFS transporter [Cupriavidus]ABF08805.1 MFS transporter, ACS family [Cupriavidus metallidurans CH34]AVA36048.1 MFS transporter [Cupriavidus metallidurans]EKZ95910.1 MFS transporter, ACS family protein [Cupriavidus sp. HMR-1]KWR82029.1 MFS transporter [Cupriavidus sp. SHE]KWW37877.1 putative tartrate transporter [Cupriavidus metallidurans]
MSIVMSGAPGAPESLPAAELAQQRNEAYRKITVRLIPFLVFLFILAWIDRVNVGFAKLQMLQDLQFSEAVYGLGAGIFFIGYFLFEVPSNLLLEKIGARKTLARITILWGLASMAMIFVKTPMQFYTLRFVLGVFEAGFFPGVVLYLTYWFPAARRARINGLFMTSFAIAGVVGGPLAGFIMSAMDGVDGLANWQWLFVIEGIPSVLAGIAVLMYLPEKPVNAKWLTQQEQTIVTRDVEAEARDPNKHSSLKDAFANARVWICAAIYFCVVSGNATIAFWSPSIIKELGVQGNLQIGLVSAIPFVAGTIAMVLNGIHSDRTGERRMHCAMATLVAAVGLTLTGFLLHSAVLALIALTIASIGILAAFPVFWSLPSAFLAGTAAAGGIALINSIGNLAGFVAPYMIGWFKTSTGQLAGGLYFVAALEACATVLVIAFIRARH